MPKIQISQFCNKPYTKHTFWSCLIRCVNMKWIQPELYVLQSGHGMWGRWTDGWTDGWTGGWTDGVNTPLQLHCAGGIIKTIFPAICQWCIDSRYLESCLSMLYWCQDHLFRYRYSYYADQIDGSVQERRNSIANALELHLSCTNPSRWS